MTGLVLGTDRCLFYGLILLLFISYYGCFFILDGPLSNPKQKIRRIHIIIAAKLQAAVFALYACNVG